MKVYYVIEKGYFEDFVYGVFSTREKACKVVLDYLEKLRKEDNEEKTILKYINEYIGRYKSVEEYLDTLICELELDKDLTKEY